jgi:hypothetical protein
MGIYDDDPSDFSGYEPTRRQLFASPFVAAPKPSSDLPTPPGPTPDQGMERQWLTDQQQSKKKNPMDPLGLMGGGSGGGGMGDMSGIFDMFGGMGF